MHNGEAFLGLCIGLGLGFWHPLTENGHPLTENGLLKQSLKASNHSQQGNQIGNFTQLNFKQVTSIYLLGFTNDASKSILDQLKDQLE